MSCKARTIPRRRRDSIGSGRNKQASYQFAFRSSRGSAPMATDVRHARDHMVEVQIAGRGIRDRRVLAAMRRVPREAFVDQGLREFAYEDNALPIAESQTISQ